MTTAQIIDLHRIRLPDGTHVSRALPSRRQRLVGSLNGLQSPVAVHSPLMAADLRCTADGEVRLPLNPAFEYALVVLDGSAETATGAIDDNRFCALAAGGSESELVFRARAGSRLLLIGGEPFGEDVLMWWNFVGRSHQEIADARADWENTAPRFGEVAGCRERIAAPELSGRVKAQSNS